MSGKTKNRTQRNKEGFRMVETWLDPSDYSKLVDLSEEQKKSKAEIVRIAIRELFEKTH